MSKEYLDQLNAHCDALGRHADVLMTLAEAFCASGNLVASDKLIRIANDLDKRQKVMRNEYGAEIDRNVTSAEASRKALVEGVMTGVAVSRWK